MTTRSCLRALRAKAFVVAAVLYLFPACNLTLVRFSGPSSVLAGDLFEVAVSANGTTVGLGGEGAGLLLEYPSIFTVENAAVPMLGVIVNYNDPVLSGLVALEPGTSLFSMWGSPQGSSTTVRIRMRAPTTPGAYVLKVALVATPGSLATTNWVATDPPGATSFAAVTTTAHLFTVNVVAGPSGAPAWRLHSAGIDPFRAYSFFGDDCSIAVADFDGDGRKDLLAGVALGGSLTNQNSSIIRAFRGRRREGYDPAPPGPPAVTNRGIVVGDFNGDGFVDRLVAFQVLLGSPGGALNFGQTLPAPSGQAATIGAAAVGDLDGDGLDDVVLSDGPTQAWRSLGNGNFAPWSNALPFFTVGTVGAVDCFDADGDLDLDIAIRHAIGVQILANNGGGNWSPLWSMTLTSNQRMIDVDAADVDADGDMDLLLIIDQLQQTASSLSTSGVPLLMRRQGGAWSADPLALTPAPDAYSSALFVDIDGDGFRDLVLAAAAETPFYAEGGHLQIWRNLNGASFARTPVYESGLEGGGLSNTYRLAAFDVDADGRDDLVLNGAFGVTVFARTSAAHTSRYGTVGVALGNGPMALLTAQGSPGDSTTRAVEIGIGQPITLSLAQSPTLAFPSRFVLWGAFGELTSAGAFASLLGTFPFVPQLVDPTSPVSFTVANSFFTDPSALIGSGPGAFSFTAINGVPFASTYSFFAIIDDPASGTSLPLSFTNCLTIDVR